MFILQTFREFWKINGLKNIFNENGVFVFELLFNNKAFFYMENWFPNKSSYLNKTSMFHYFINWESVGFRCFVLHWMIFIHIHVITEIHRRHIGSMDYIWRVIRKSRKVLWTSGRRGCSTAKFLFRSCCQKTNLEWKFRISTKSWKTIKY